MCKDGHPATVVWPLFVARNLFLDQYGFVSGSGSLPVFVLLFEEHANPGFSVCANKIEKLSSLYVAICKVRIRIQVGLQGVSEK